MRAMRCCQRNNAAHIRNPLTSVLILIKTWHKRYLFVNDELINTNRLLSLDYHLLISNMTIVITKGDNPGNYIYVDVNADFATPVTDVSAEYRLPMYLLSSIVMNSAC
jgi:hypothetical protein